MNNMLSTGIDPYSVLNGLGVTSCSNTATAGTVVLHTNNTAAGTITLTQPSNIYGTSENTYTLSVPKMQEIEQRIDRIEERLCLLTPIPELENEWNELKELRSMYINKEKEIYEKKAIWDKLKK